MQELRIEQKHAGRPDEHVVVIPVNVLQIVDAVPVIRKRLDFTTCQALTFCAKPPAKGRDVTSEREHCKEHSEEGAAYPSKKSAARRSNEY